MNETVLIVEDDSDIIEILSLYLCGSDYQVETAANGKLGLELLERKSPSVILVDLMMPEMNGVDFIKEARAVLRRCNALSASGPSNISPDGSVVRMGAIEFDKESLIVRKNNNVVSFTASELKIFSKLFSSPGRVYTKAQLYEVISASSHGGGEDSIMVHISNIRSKIEDDPNNPAHIVTVRGLGYRFEG